MKRFTKTAAALCGIVLCTAALTVPAMALKLPKEIEHATKDGATVSERVDTADNNDNTMGTRYYMYIEPDIIYSAKAIPKLGDEGVDFITLALASLSVGTAYLGVSAYAFDGEKNL